MLFIWPLLYLLTAIYIAALVAYPVSQLLDANFGLARIINRITLGLLVLGILPVKKWLGMSFEGMGFSLQLADFSRQLLAGFMIGLLILGIAISTLIYLKVRTVVPAVINLPGKLSHEFYASLRTGLIVGLLEETLFRGLLFGALLKYGSTASALTITAFFYASLHFIHGRNVPAPTHLDWTSGFSMVPDALIELFDTTHFDSFLALFFVSIFLSCVRLHKPIGLGYCIGLHASWVFLLRLTKSFTESTPSEHWGFLVGTYDGIIGYLTGTWLMILAAIFLIFIYPKRKAIQSTIDR